MQHLERFLKDQTMNEVEDLLKVYQELTVDIGHLEKSIEVSDM